MIQLFAVLLICGLILIGAEVFVPGGILGGVGAVFVFGAALMAFTVFGPVIGGYVALGIVVLVGVAVYLWIRFFPRSSIGRKMTMSQDLSAAKASADGLGALLGREGEALSDLRPAGYARIDGQRVDVLTEGGMIGKGEVVKVVNVEGNRVVVARKPAPGA